MASINSTGDWRALVSTWQLMSLISAHPTICIKRWRWKRFAMASMYLEKPLALNAHDAREMVEAAKRAG